jgi:hypothetical protein
MHVVQGNPADHMSKMLVAEGQDLGGRADEPDRCLPQASEAIAQGQGFQIDVDADALRRLPWGEKPEGLAGAAANVQDAGPRSQVGAVKMSV